jgi:hypothetical protein
LRSRLNQKAVICQNSPHSIFVSGWYLRY